MEKQELQKKKLDFVDKSVKFHINELVAEADKYTRSMNEDYEYFFRWYAEDMYKVQLELSEYRKLNAVVNTEDVVATETYLRNKIRNFTDDLLGGSLRLCSTSATHSLAHTFAVEVKQRLRERFASLLDRFENE